MTTRLDVVITNSNLQESFDMHKVKGTACISLRTFNGLIDGGVDNGVAEANVDDADACLVGDA